MHLRVSSDAKAFYAHEAGSHRLASVASGASVREFEYTAAGSTDQPLRFSGQEWDAATGLSQNWNRDYDPTLGRYIESDPIGLEGWLSNVFSPSLRSTS